ncbi:hypothetical protein FHR72_000415 [Mycolicibacterium iranicum]|uniref:Secretion protein EspD n=1 Tax=Mycolicibacterium iranicum TaxID=912594 RepID=A0A839PXP2_MYCIR|nr:hypothetical protein [Mycolicibacterium iranicum]MBB2988958.1 hypothetical protein [Mycolicibacterium iranicum]
MAIPPPGLDDGDDDDLAALDYSAAGSVDGETDLGEILGGYGYAEDEDSEGPGAGSGAGLDAEGPAMPTFTVTNPPGTVTVTTFMDGRVYQIDLSSGASSLTEAVLADEILVIAGLATQDARSAQYTFMLEGMREQGHDTVATRDFLNRDLELPTPEQARAARAALFTNRYAGEE